MAGKSVHAIRNELRSVLNKVRAESAALEKKRATLDPRWSDEAKRNAMAGWRAESAARIDGLAANVAALTKDGLDLQDHWTTRSYLSRQPLTKSTGSDTTQAQILEELSQLRMAQALPRLTKEEIGKRVDGAIEGGKWGELGVLLGEIDDRRRVYPDQFEWPLLATTIERLSPPEVAEAYATITEIRNVSQWIMSARQSVATGERDLGVAMEQSLIAQHEKDAGQYDEAKARMRLVINAAKNAA